MTAADHLSEAQFFHGTSTAAFTGGDVIDPRQQHARTFSVSSPDRVYFTSDQTKASFYATRAAEKHGGDPVVLRVSPTGQHMQDWQTRHSPENRTTRHPLRVLGPADHVNWQATHYER